MNDYSSEIITELLQRTAVVAVAAVLIAGLLSVVRPASARIHRLLWCLVLLQGWMFLQYQLPIPWYETPPVIETEKTVVASASAGVEINSSPLEDETVDLALENDPSTNSFPATLPVAATKNVTQNTNLSKAPVTIASPATLYWPTVLVGVWITGMLLIVARWLFGYIRFVRSVPTAEVPDDRLSVRWDGLLKKRGVKQTIALRLSESLGPMLCRLPRGYTLFLPQQFWNGLSELEQTIVLEHELAHYLRRDVWKSLIVRLLALPHWFNPCAWWAVRRFDQCAEWACDAAAWHLEPEQRISYAKTLMRLVEQAGTAQPCQPALFGSSVLYRVKRLLSPQPPEDTKMKKLVLCSLVLLLIAFSLIRPQLVAQTPVSTETTGTVQTEEIQSGDTEVVRLPESNSAAQAKQQPAVPREKLRYDGKSFEEWKELLNTELKPERRAEALKALGEFGANGYSEDSAKFIFEVSRNYAFGQVVLQSEEIAKVQEAAMKAFVRLATPEAMELLKQELRSGEPSRQWFAIRILGEQGVSVRSREKYSELTKLAIPELLELTSKETSLKLWRTAVERISSINPKAENVVHRLRELMSDKDNKVAFTACRSLAETAPETKGLAKRIVELAKEYNWSALQWLYVFGPKMEIRPALPDLMALIEHPISSTPFLSKAFAAIGEDALNPLIEDYKKSDRPRKRKILKIFQGMWPKAKPALPFLSQVYIAETDWGLKLDLTKTFRSIIGDPIERERFLIKLYEKAKKAREEKKKVQDRELDGVGFPMKSLLR